MRSGKAYEEMNCRECLVLGPVSVSSVSRGGPRDATYDWVGEFESRQNVLVLQDHAHRSRNPASDPAPEDGSDPSRTRTRSGTHGIQAGNLCQSGLIGSPSKLCLAREIPALVGSGLSLNKGWSFLVSRNLLKENPSRSLSFSKSPISIVEEA